jgi:hypothetical protein
MTAPHAATLASAAPGQAHRGRLFRRHLLPGRNPCSTQCIALRMKTWSSTIRNFMPQTG